MVLFGLYVVYIVFIAIVNMNDMVFNKWYLCCVFDVMSFCLLILVTDVNHLIVVN